VPDGFRDVNGRDRCVVARHRERYAVARELRAADCTTSGTAARLQVNRQTAARFAAGDSIDELLVKATSPASILDPLKPSLSQHDDPPTGPAPPRRHELQHQAHQTAHVRPRQLRPATCKMALLN
jgi:hypothetical protein